MQHTWKDIAPLENGVSPPDASIAAYIGEMAAELSVLAQKSGLPFLAYFLTLVKMEAEHSSLDCEYLRERMRYSADRPESTCRS
jgi:hypothetical protein